MVFLRRYYLLSRLLVIAFSDTEARLPPFDCDGKTVYGAMFVRSEPTGPVAFLWLERWSVESTVRAT